jgi:hypothetical protein
VDCLLVNTTGELKLFYEHATVIFVGKSLSAQGGQNPIEPGHSRSHGFRSQHAELFRDREPVPEGKGRSPDSESCRIRGGYRRVAGGRKAS